MRLAYTPEFPPDKARRRRGRSSSLRPLLIHDIRTSYAGASTVAQEATTPQSGSKSLGPLLVIGLFLEPSEFILRIVALLVKAIFLPSGEKAGSSSGTPFLVSLV